VAVRDVPVDLTGELLPQVVGGYALEATDEHGDGQLRRVADEQVHVVVLTIELNQFRAHDGAHVPHDLLAPGEHGAGEYAAPVSGDEDKMHMQVVNDAPSSAYIRVWLPSWRHRQDGILYG
jgi:hypothetical protein